MRDMDISDKPELRAKMKGKKPLFNWKGERFSVHVVYWTDSFVEAMELRRLREDQGYSRLLRDVKAC